MPPPLYPDALEGFQHAVFAEGALRGEAKQSSQVTRPPTSAGIVIGDGKRTRAPETAAGIHAALHAVAARAHGHDRG